MPLLYRQRDGPRARPDSSRPSSRSRSGAAEGAEIAFGSTGCTRFIDRAAQDGATLTIGPRAITNMACPEPSGAQEDTILRLLAVPLTVTVELLRDQLTLTSTEGEPLRLQRKLD